MPNCVGDKISFVSVLLSSCCSCTHWTHTVQNGDGNFACKFFCGDDGCRLLDTGVTILKVFQKTYTLLQCFSAGVPQNIKVLPVAPKGSAKSNKETGIKQHFWP